MRMLFSLQPLYLCLPVLPRSRYTGSKDSAGIFLLSSLVSRWVLHNHMPSLQPPILLPPLASPLRLSVPEILSFLPVHHPLGASFFFFPIQDSNSRQSVLIQHFRHYFGPLPALTLPSTTVYIPSSHNSSQLHYTRYNFSRLRQQ